MTRALLFAFCCLSADVLFGAIAAGTWNLKWFPSGRAEHRASSRVEAANVEDAAEMVRGACARAGSADGVVLCFQEVRDAACASNLVVAVGRPNLRVAAVTEFRNPDRRLGWQQCAIVTDFPVVEAHWSRFRRSKGVLPPRGYAYALLDAGTNGLVAVFCVHLKSNYGATTDEIRAANARKRAVAAEEIARVAKRIIAPDGRPVAKTLVLGDFNADAFPASRRKRAKHDVADDERTFAALAEVGFENCFRGVPLAERATHPGSTRYPDSTLDYVLFRGFAKLAYRNVMPLIELSDHRMVLVGLD